VQILARFGCVLGLDDFPINRFTAALPLIRNVLPAAFAISHLPIPPPSCRWQASIKKPHADPVMASAAIDIGVSCSRLLKKGY